jgi:SanA protein
MRLKWYKLAPFGIVALLVVVLGFPWYANILVSNAGINKTYNRVEEVPYTRVGLLLGTSRFVKSGSKNLYFKYRIEAATSLLKSGKIKYLIISGDNGNKSYDEPTDMKNELVANGIDSTKLYLDYAGFRTFDSIVRAKEVFGQDTLLIISQKFHNERAIYIANRLGMHAIGFNAKDVQKAYGLKTTIREWFARVKVMVDFWFGVDPKFLGKKITIG